MRIFATALVLAALLFPGAGWAAIAHVQDMHTRDSSGSSTSTVAVALLGVTAGNTIGCGIAWANQTASLSTVSDGTNNYTLVHNPTAASSLWRSAMAYMPSSIGGNVTITATLSGASTNVKIIVCHEVSGTDTTAVMDTSAMSDIGAVGGGTDNVSQSVTITNPGTYIMGFFLNYGQNGAVTAGTGYTLGEQFAGNNGASVYRANYGSTGPTNVLATDGSFDTHMAGVLVFKAGSAAPSINVFSRRVNP